MNWVTLIQLRGNISYTLSGIGGIGGIGSKYNPTIVSISYQVRESTLLFDEVPWSTVINKPDSHKIWRRGSIQDNTYLSYLKQHLILHAWGSLLSLKSRPFLWWPALPVIPLIIEDVPGMIVIIIKGCVPAIQTLLCIMAELIANKTSVFLSTLRSRLPIEVIFRPSKTSASPFW